MTRVLCLALACGLFLAALATSLGAKPVSPPPPVMCFLCFQYYDPEYQGRRWACDNSFEEGADGCTLAFDGGSCIMYGICP